MWQTENILNQTPSIIQSLKDKNSKFNIQSKRRPWNFPHHSSWSWKRPPRWKLIQKLHEAKTTFIHFQNEFEDNLKIAELTEQNLKEKLVDIEKPKNIYFNRKYNMKSFQNRILYIKHIMKPVI